MTSTTPPDPGGRVGTGADERASVPDGGGGPAVDGRATRWESHRRRRRVELIDQSVRAIRRNGAGVGLDDIAAQAGTSKTVLYRHFEDRAGLYRAVAERVESQIVGRVEASLTPGAAPREVLASVIDTYLALVERDPELYRFVVRRPLVEGSLDDDPVSGISTHVADLVTRVLADGGLDASLARTWAVAFVGSVQACADDWLAGDPASRPSRADLTARLVDLVAPALEHRR